MKAGAYQFKPLLFDADRNRARMLEALGDFTGDLAVFPELCSTGYYFRSQDELSQQAETASGETCSIFRQMAVDRRMTIVFGFAERDGDDFYNSAAAALPDGVLRLYRKTHLFYKEKKVFEPGNSGFEVFDVDGVGIGVMICYDWRFPEAARTLALKGAQVICHPSALVALPELWQPVMRARSFENRVITITADRNGSETRGGETLVFHGCSQIVDVNGKTLAEADEAFEGWIEADLDPARAERKSISDWNAIFSDRRPEMYELR